MGEPTLFNQPRESEAPEPSKGREDAEDGEPTRCCPTCGQRMPKLNPHRMDQRKVWLLEAIARLNRQGFDWVKMQCDEALIRPEDQQRTILCDGVHARRLDWFGLVVRRGRRTGEYAVTAKGLAFLAGRATVPARIWCRGGRVERVDQEQVSVGQVAGVHLDKSYWDRYYLEQSY